MQATLRGLQSHQHIEIKEVCDSDIDHVQRFDHLKQHLIHHGGNQSEGKKEKSGSREGTIAGDLTAYALH